MRILQGVKQFFKPLVDVSTWVGYRTLVDNGKSVIKNTKRIFTPPPGEGEGEPETFQQAASRLQLTENDIQKQEKTFLILAIFWLVVALLLLAYALWLFTHGGFMAGLLALSLVFLASTLVFRYHFWHYQIKKRTLGSNFQQWLNSWTGVKK
jgi:intracellular multiplication protein IcmV